MARRIGVTVMATSIAFLSTPVVFANSTASPAPSSSISATPTAAGPTVKTHHIVVSGQPLTTDQKVGMSLAKKTLSTALRTAKSTFQLFVADSQANRDQAILAANGDKKAKLEANVQFKSALAVARQNMQNAISQANMEYWNTLNKLGIISPQPK